MRKNRYPEKTNVFFAAGSPVAIVQGFVSQGKIEIFTTVSAALRNQKPFTKLLLKCPGRRNLDSKSGPVNNWAQAMGHGPRPRDLRAVSDHTPKSLFRVLARGRH